MQRPQVQVGSKKAVLTFVFGYQFEIKNSTMVHVDRSSAGANGALLATRPKIADDSDTLLQLDSGERFRPDLND